MPEAMTPKAETRQIFGQVKVEQRGEGDAKAPVLVGYAAVYGRQSEDLGGFIEIIEAGAFRDVLAGSPDVRALVNHDSNQILGRTKSGTLRLSEDNIGLRYEIDVPNTVAARSIVAAIERGDVDGSSFSFRLGPDDSKWDVQASAESPMIRRISRIAELFDVGPVTFPAYPDTTAAKRSMEEARKSPDEGEGEGANLDNLRLRTELNAKLAGVPSRA